MSQGVLPTLTRSPDGRQQIPAIDRDMHQQQDHDDHHGAQRRRDAIPQVDSQPEAEGIGHRRPDRACRRLQKPPAGDREPAALGPGRARRRTMPCAPTMSRVIARGRAVSVGARAMRAITSRTRKWWKVCAARVRMPGGPLGAMMRGLSPRPTKSSPAKVAAKPATVVKNACQVSIWSAKLIPLRPLPHP